MMHQLIRGTKLQTKTGELTVEQEKWWNTENNWQTVFCEGVDVKMMPWVIIVLLTMGNEM